MAKPDRAYRSEKRRKELSRQKKKEEKRKRYINKGASTSQDTEKIHAEDIDTEQKD